MKIIPTYSRSEFVLIVFIFVVHLAGIIGLNSVYKEFFVLVTPATLLLLFVTLVFHHEEKSKSFYIYLSVIVLLGFLIEMLGVNTGWPFGEYFYGKPFGWKIAQTPLVIGLNWFVLTYCGAFLCRNITKMKWLNALFSGILITAVDFVIEPVAIQLEYWTWASETIPLENYITWFVCISIFSFLIYKLESAYSNKLAVPVFLAQIFFFIALNIF